MNSKNIIVKRLSHAEAKEKIDSLARLRILVFRDFPYLYDGDLEYEKQYLKTYLDSPNSAIIVAQDLSLSADQNFIGAATAIPLIDEVYEVQKPFIEANYNIETIYYFGESVLHKKYRGLGIGHLFFNEREKAALENPKITTTCFCAVQRPSDHPMKPIDYKPLDEFWKKRGYSKVENLVSYFNWKDLGQDKQTSKPMTYWMKQWSRKYIISSCLLGEKCRYDGGHKLNEKLFELYKLNPEQFIAVCPEELGGLPTPRPPCEKVNRQTIQTKDGVDKTQEYKTGASKALEIINTTIKNSQSTIEAAFLKSKSPMCGYKKIYDGTFTGNLTNGNGEFTELLIQEHPQIHIQSVD